MQSTSAFEPLRAWVRQQRARAVGVRAVRLGADAVHPDSVGGWLDAQAWRTGVRDRGAARLIARVVPVDGTAVDVGAYLGWITLALARAVGPHGRVLALEPEANNFDLLTRAAAPWRFPQVDARALAAGEYSGWTSLYLAERERGDHRTVPAAEERRTVTVHAASLDDLLADAPRLDLVKISTQGTEVSVLRGLRRTLVRCPSAGLLVAVAPALLERAGASAAALFEPLAAAGLRPHRIAADGDAVPADPASLWDAARLRGRLLVYFAR